MTTPAQDAKEEEARALVGQAGTSTATLSPFR
jgi:hypothetical protein